MISPQHLINTGICGLFCVTLFSLAGTKSATRPIVVTQPVPVGQDYTLHIKTGNVQQRISSPVWMYESNNTRTLEQRNQQAREKRAQFEELFTRSPNAATMSRPSSMAGKVQSDEPAETLKRARNAVHRGIELGKDVSDSQ